MNLQQEFANWRQKCIESGELKDGAGRDPSWELFKQHKSDDGRFEPWMRNVNSVFVKEFFSLDNRECTEEEMLKQNVKYKMQMQRFQDNNRIERATFRSHARVHNALEEYSKEIVRVLHTHDLSKVTIKHEATSTNCGGVVQLSDAHFNELINVLGNTYDFNVAAKRLKRLAIQTKRYFKPLGVKSVLLALTGDMLNSNRRLDELLNQATNRADASMLAFYLLKQFILDLNQDFNILVASVSGNESRIEPEHGFSNSIARDNFDFTIENLLRVQFQNCEGVYFVDGNAKEKVVNVAGHNILILHGEGIGGKDTQKAIQQKIGMYALKNIIIHYVMYGHLHSAHVSDYSSRSSSLGGSNAYNEDGLGLIGRASQNIGVFYDDGNRDIVKIDLQCVDNIEGYDIIKELEAYHAKSASKLHHNHVVFQVVI